MFEDSKGLEADHLTDSETITSGTIAGKARHALIVFSVGYTLVRMLPDSCLAKKRSCQPLWLLSASSVEFLRVQDNNWL